MRAKEQSRWAWKCVVAVALGLTVLAGSVHGREVRGMEELLPQDMVFFLSWDNPAGTEGYRESALHAILQEPEMRDFVAHVRGELERLDRSHRGRLPVSLSLSKMVLEEGLTSGFTVAASFPAQGQRGRSVPRFVLSLRTEGPPEEAEQRVVEKFRRLTGGRFGERRRAFTHRGRTVKSLGPQGQPAFYTMLPGRWVLATSEQDIRAIVGLADGEGRSLADSGRFSRVTRKSGGAGAALTLYADVERLLAFARAFLPPQAGRALGTLQLDRIRAMGVASRFEDGGLRDSLYLLMPGRAPGLFPAAGDAVDAALLDCVPANAERVCLFRMRFRAIYGTAMTLLQRTAPQAHRQFRSALTKWEQRAGFSVTQDLLASLGSQAMVYSAPHEHVLMVQVRDRATFTSCLEKTAARWPKQVRLGELEYRGRTIRHLDITGLWLPVSPSWTYYRGHAVFGLYPQTVKRFLARMEEGGPSIRDNEEFRRVHGESLDGYALIGYVDAGEDVAYFYDFAVVAAQVLHAAPSVQIRPELMPPSSILEPHLFDSSTVCVSDDGGVLLEHVSPLGCGGTLAAAVGSMGRAYVRGSFFSLPIVAGVLMPAFTRARSAAEQTACMHNLKQIGVACMMWQTDHDGKLPEKLSDLYPSYVGSPEIFVCPEDAEPFSIGDGLKGSYHYVGSLPGRPSRASVVIIAYEEMENHGDVRNVLFLDGHVARLGTRITGDGRFSRALQTSLDVLKESVWEECSPEQRRAIRHFHSPPPFSGENVLPEPPGAPR